MLEFFLEMQGLKNVKRYAEHHEVFKESVTDHSYMVCFMALELIEKLGLELDAIKVMKFALVYDLGEIGLESDYDAVLTSLSTTMQLEKREYEERTVKHLCQKFNKPQLLSLFLEYEKQDTDEAKFVKAVDKLETNIHCMKCGAKNFDSPDFVVNYCDNAISSFPLLKPFYKELKEYMEKEFLNANIEWKENYKND